MNQVFCPEVWVDASSSYFDDFFIGCPFRHTDLDLLKQKLKSMSIGTDYYDKVIFCSGIQFNLLLSPYPCFISLLYLDLYVLGDDALIS